jgi:hypothetical protein
MHLSNKNFVLNSHSEKFKPSIFRIFFVFFILYHICHLHQYSIKGMGLKHPPKLVVPHLNRGRWPRFVMNFWSISYVLHCFFQPQVSFFSKKIEARRKSTKSSWQDVTNCPDLVGFQLVSGMFQTRPRTP